MFFKSKQQLGLDIGSSSVKFAEVQFNKGVARLDSFYFAQTPQGMITGGEIQSNIGLGNLIAQTVSQHQIKQKTVSAGVWGSGVIVKKISVPKMDVKLLKEQVKFEAEQYIPYGLDEVNIEFSILKHQSSFADSMDLLLVAVKKDLVMSYAEAIEGADLSLTTMDVNGFALANCFEINYPNLDVNHVGLLNIGASSSNFVVMHNKDVVFVRDIMVGGSNYTQEIQKAMGISQDEAENLKISAATTQDAPAEVIDVLKQTNEAIAEEIQRSVEFYSASSGNANPIQRFYISGGSYRIPDLIPTLSKVLNAKVEIHNPFIQVTYNSKTLTPDYVNQISPYAPIAVGLAMRKQGDEE
jgi:type IV pilus assembly protein PilM